MTGNGRPTLRIGLSKSRTTIDDIVRQARRAEAGKPQCSVIASDRLAVMVIAGALPQPLIGHAALHTFACHPLSRANVNAIVASGS